MLRTLSRARHALPARPQAAAAAGRQQASCLGHAAVAEARPPGALSCLGLAALLIVDVGQVALAAAAAGQGINRVRPVSVCLLGPSMQKSSSPQPAVPQLLLEPLLQ